MPQDVISQFDRKFAAPIETDRQVSNIPERDSIETLVRWEGMLVHVKGDQTYILGAALDNTAWEPIGGRTSILIIDGYFAKKGVGKTGAGFEIGDFGHGWDGEKFVAFKVTGLPYTTTGNRVFAVNQEVGL